MELYNKVIFLTGGSEGIGRECGRAYIKEGARLVIVANDALSLAHAKHEFGQDHLFICCDVGKAHEVEMAFEQTLSKFGRIDCIHNNAGIAHPAKTLDETTDQEWENLMNVNLKGIYHTVKYGIDALKETAGSILNTSSMVGEIGQELHAAYVATKGGINGLTKAMALDYAKYHIRVNAVSPSGVYTPMLHKWKEEQPNPQLIGEYLDAMHPLGYCPNADVVADACVFLLSDRARFITGCIMPVSGGAELGYRSVLATSLENDV
ncbi:short-chain dehydrogenase [Niastella koreensis]|uniref:3-oxoacyl-(Acyl-carrier-protein) reductase n=2 Tax=Niastella koreensis TaxID=354356 RepID=G8TRD8_NIAKG|nr:SDR family oxidoreductase [Niastella koreensis]AEW00060.1 3-oxoacyl-(acyl-carrier-protein) reductase [Niastella koreensis GR20-10]OQP49632.1 short-chain dehydrogenase [Niastella koreensis]